MGSQFTEAFDQSLWVLRDDEKCIKKMPLRCSDIQQREKFQCGFVFLIISHISLSYSSHTQPHFLGFAVIVWGKIPFNTKKSHDVHSKGADKRPCQTFYARTSHYPLAPWLLAMGILIQTAFDENQK